MPAGAACSCGTPCCLVTIVGRRFVASDLRALEHQDARSGDACLLPSLASVRPHESSPASCPTPLGLPAKRRSANRFSDLTKDLTSLGIGSIIAVCRNMPLEGSGCLSMPWYESGLGVSLGPLGRSAAHTAVVMDRWHPQGGESTNLGCHPSRLGAMGTGILCY